MQLRRARLDRGAYIGGGGELFVFDGHGFRRIAGLVLGLGDDNRDGLSDEAHRLRRHRRPGAHFHRRAVFRGDGPAANQIADLVINDLFAGEHVDHARHILRRGDIDALDLGVGVRAADEMRVGHADQLDVVDVAALAGDETLVFLAHHACANAFNAHVLSSRPEIVEFPPFPSKSGGVERN